MKKLTIPVKLPTLNEYIKTSNKNRFAANSLKQKTEKLIGLHLIGVTLEPCTPYYIIIEWYNYRTDPDNTEFAQKFIFDALQKNGILENDNANYILQKVHFHTKTPEKLQSQTVSFFSEKKEFLEYFSEKMKNL